MLLIFGELPSRERLERFRGMLTDEQLLHEGMRYHFEGFPSHGHPMAMLSAMINACGCYHPELLSSEMDEERLLRATATLMSKVCTIAAFSYKMTMGRRMEYPDPSLSYCRNFLHMMFSKPHRRYEPPLQVVRALTKFLILHADHEQNCSTSTVRLVGSSQANLFTSISGGINALWGPLHGGANQAVLEMLEKIRTEHGDVRDFVKKVKNREDGVKLMGFGHRVYKNYDPRARIVKEQADKILGKLGGDDELLDIAKSLEEIALTDDFFIERKLYPNVDYYTGVIYRAMGFPTRMFTVLFALGRLPGWIAHWREMSADPSTKIGRPRQIYTGYTERDYPAH